MQLSRWGVVVLVALRAGAAGAHETTQALVFSADGKTLASASRDDFTEDEAPSSDLRPAIYFWDVAAGTAKKPISPNTYTMDFDVMAFTPDAKHLMAGSIFWDVASHKPTRGLRVYSLSKDGKRMVTPGEYNMKNHVRVLDTASGKVLLDKEMMWTFAALSPDGSQVAAIGENHFRIWKVAGGDELANVYTRAFRIAWSADGSRIAVVDASDDAHTDVTLYDSSGKVVVATVTRDAPHPHAVGYGPDGKWLVIGADNGLSWLRTKDLSLWALWGGDASDVTALAYTPDGSGLAIGHSKSGLIQILDTNKNNVTVLKTFKTPYLKLKADSDPFAEKDPEPESEGPDKLPPGWRVKPEVKPEVKTETPPEPDKPEAKPEPEKPAPKQLSSAQKEAVQAVQQAAMNALNWLKKIRNPDEYKDELAKPSFMQLAKSEADDCVKALAAARKLGVPGDTPIDYNDYDASGKNQLHPMSELDGLVCQPLLKGAGARVDAQQGEKAAQYAPFLKVLSGDKAKIFQDQNMVDGLDCSGPRCSGMYGHKMKRLKTPADFKGSDVWYYFVHVQDAAVPTWEVEGWVFSGMKKSKTYDKTGKGDLPPASAFK